MAAWEFAAPSKETTASNLSLGMEARIEAVSSRTTRITGDSNAALLGFCIVEKEKQPLTKLTDILCALAKVAV